VTMGESRGASNAKARLELGWVPRYSSWREGFIASYGHVKGPTAVHTQTNLRTDRR
jgi:hypothetical protein